MAKKTKTFSVGGFIKVWASIEIEATSLQDAVEQSKGLSITDFIAVHGDHNDSSLKIIQVFDADFNCEA